MTRTCSFTTEVKYEAMKNKLAKGDVCAVIIEGIQGVGGIQLPTDEFMQALREACTAHNTILVLDEIQSGYGRSGKFFAHQYNGIKADIITVAKGIGNVSQWPVCLSVQMCGSRLREGGQLLFRR